MTNIQSQNCNVYFNLNAYKAINDYLENTAISKIFVVVDSNTHEHCLPLFMSELTSSMPIEIIEIEPGEIHKNIETCSGVWEALSELDADRKALMINLGGGVVTDLGGFVACTYKRGIKYINVPTSLLSMVDASVGGKTGVDLGVLKNQVGVISTGEMVLIDTRFLKTLPDFEVLSGLAEMYKHGLIYDRNYWNMFKNLSQVEVNQLDELIWRSVDIKNNIVTEDPRENGVRKTLNFGHTIGHAIESYLLNHPNKKSVLHGQAIAAGMLMEAFISSELLQFPSTDLNDIKNLTIRLYEKIELDKEDYPQIIDLLKYDKKNSYGNVNFVLLNDIAKPELDCLVDNHLILNSFEYYQNCYK